MSGHFYLVSTHYNTCKNCLVAVPELGSDTSSTLVPASSPHTSPASLPPVPCPCTLWLYWPTCSFPSITGTARILSLCISYFPSLLSVWNVQVDFRSSPHYSLLHQANLRRLSSFSIALSALSPQPSSLPVPKELACLPFHQTLSSWKAGTYVLCFHPFISATYKSD